MNVEKNNLQKLHSNDNLAENTICLFRLMFLDKFSNEYKHAHIKIEIR